MKTKTARVFHLADYFQQQNIHCLQVHGQTCTTLNLRAQPLTYSEARHKLLSEGLITEKAASQFLFYSHPLCITTKDFIQKRFMSPIVSAAVSKLKVFADVVVEVNSANQPTCLPISPDLIHLLT